MGGSRAISRWRSSSSTPVCRLPGTISGSRSASLEPDTNSKIYFTLSPEPRVRWDRRGILANPISGTAVLEYGPAEILPPVGAISKHPARLCRPGRQASRAHPRGKPGFSTFESGCGRETDCLLEGDGFEPSVPGTKQPIFVAEGELRGPNEGSQSGEPTIPACQSNNAFAPIPAVRGATTAP